MARIPRIAYSITRDFSLTFTLSTWFIFLLIGGMMAAVNLAADGYQTLTIISSDFNYTQPFWYDRFIPSFLLPTSSSSTPCQPYTYHVGDTFRTTSKIFNWQVQDVMEATDEDGNVLQGNVHSNMPYSNVPLEYCDVVNIQLSADIVLRTAITQIKILCELPIPLAAVTTVSSSELPSRASVVDTPWLTSYNSSFTFTPQLNVSMAVNILGWDLLAQMADMYLFSGGTSPTVLETKFDFGDSYCPARFVGTPGWCTESQNEALPTWSMSAGDYFGYANFSLYGETELNLSEYMMASPAYWNPVRNFLRASHAAARADLGSFRPSNMFQNLSMLPIAINSTGFLEVEGRTAAVPLEAAAILLNETGVSFFNSLPMPLTNASMLDTTYVCNRKFLKPPATLFFAITSGTLSNCLVLWGLWMLICSRWVKLNHLSNVCNYHNLEGGLLVDRDGRVLNSPKHNKDAEGSTHGRSPSSAATSSRTAWEDEPSIGHQYPPAPSWMVNLPYGKRDYNYSSIQMADMKDPKDD